MGILGRVLRKVIGSTKQEHIKEYGSYDDALKDCPTQKTYENQELCFMIGDKTINHKKGLGEKPYLLNATNAFLVNAVQNYFLEFLVKDITILDFGGACGAHFFETRRFFGQNYNIKWFVVETPEMVKSAKEHKLGTDELNFVDDIEKLNTSVDFIHSSGALQYVPDWVGYLKQLIECGAKYMLFNRMMFNENDRTFVTIQKSKLSDNGPGLMPEKYVDKNIFYPHTTISNNEFNKIIMRDGYNPEWSFDEHTGSYRINNEKIIGKGLLYKKC